MNKVKGKLVRDKVILFSEKYLKKKGNNLTQRRTRIEVIIQKIVEKNTSQKGIRKTKTKKEEFGSYRRMEKRN